MWVHMVRDDFGMEREAKVRVFIGTVWLPKKTERRNFSEVCLAKALTLGNFRIKSINS